MRHYFEVLTQRWGKIIIVWISAIVFALVLYFITRSIVNNNLLQARRYHKLGEIYFQKGDMNRSSIYYEIANLYREKAYKQMEE